MHIIYIIWPHICSFRQLCVYTVIIHTHITHTVECRIKKIITYSRATLRAKRANGSVFWRRGNFWGRGVSRIAVFLLHVAIKVLCNTVATIEKVDTVAVV